MTKPYYLHPDHEDYISKTDLKKEAKDLQSFAMKLIKLSKSHRSQLAASDELLAAMTLADKIKTKPDALRRHIQYMAKQLKDEDLSLLQQQVDDFNQPGGVSAKLTKKIETIRDELIEQGDEMINQLVQQNPNLERQKLRQLVRQAKKEWAQEKPDKNYKELFQFLKNTII